MPLKMARAIQVGGPAWHWANFAKVARNFEWEKKVAGPMGSSLVVREPIGVVGCITPWNFPLSQITLKIAPAMVAGCTVVLKPSEIAPVNAMILAEIIHEAGLPPGVFNLVNGLGPVVGEVLATHPEVDMVSFTGSTRAGKRVSELASASVKRIALELGGKSASVILDDANFEVAVKGTVGACMLNSGQTCSAHTRMLVPASRYEEVKVLAKAAIAKFSIGPSLDEASKLGPLISANQRDRVLGFIKTGIEEGADVIAGGAEPPKFDKGYFVQPTILGIKSTDTLAREEIFGPVLTLFVYKAADWKSMFKLVDETSEYSLTGAVIAQDRQAIADATEGLKNASGNFYINDKCTGAVVGQQPFGGARGSGTNDKAGSELNLLRWLSARTIKENLKPAKDYRYPFMDAE